MSMDIKNSSPIQNSLIMIIAEEQHTLRTLFDDIEPDENGHQYIPSHEFKRDMVKRQMNCLMKFMKNIFRQVFNH